MDMGHWWSGTGKVKKKYRCAAVSLVIRSKTYRGYVKKRIIPNAIYNVIFV
jgi:hypothetical protein